MIITHNVKEKISKDVNKDNISLFLMSKRGNYFSLSADPSKNISNFNGWFNFLGNEKYSLYKSIENIYHDDGKNMLIPREISNDFIYFDRIYENFVERFTLVKNGLIYDILKKKDLTHINIDLDLRDIFDFNDQGRIYNIYKEKIILKGKRSQEDILIIEYTKYSDNALNNVQGKHFMIIYGLEDFYEIVNKWQKKDYDYDRSRGSRSGFYVYNALKIASKNESRIIFTFSDNKESAKEKLIDIVHNMKLIQEVHANYIDNTLSQKLELQEITGKDSAMAYVNSIHALDGINVSINVDHKKLAGLWAGLPWFFQFWARDELISLKALMLEKKFEIAKLILFRHINELMPDGRISNLYPSTQLGSADAIGWLYRRVYDIIILLEEYSDLSKHINLHELKYLRERLQFSIKQMMNNYYTNELIINKPLETWMDTFSDNDYREGFRIEIQALFLGMLRLMNMLNNMLANKFVKKDNKLVSITKSEFDYRKLEREFARVVRERFVVKIINGKESVIMNDGFNSSNADVCRPNLFLAHYIYPDLLHNEEWEKVFDYALEKLWCEWDTGKNSGGLSTIDKSNRLFCGKYTGQNNSSYHRGDSWFFINNLAAVAMHHLNKEKYYSYIVKILNASTEDILYDGFIGYASELSSALEFSPGGCFCQTWSIATYIELIHEMFL